jgi:hypothetical protein
MLAYVFWHWPQSSFERTAYESRLIDFQTALERASPQGYRSACVFRIPSVPWLAAPGDAYEDWYLVDGSAALDPLNDAAVSGLCRVPHDAAASPAAGGAAGLYRLRAGEPVCRSGPSNWFTKPAGMSYPELHSLLQPLTDRADVALWGRQMVLGPAPEFCLHTREAADVPLRLSARMIERAIVWPRRG